MKKRLVDVKCLGIDWHFEVTTERSEDGWAAEAKVAREGLLAVQGAATEDQAIEAWKEAACTELTSAQEEARRRFPPE